MEKNVIKVYPITWKLLAFALIGLLFVAGGGWVLLTGADMFYRVFGGIILVAGLLVTVQLLIRFLREVLILIDVKPSYQPNVDATDIANSSLEETFAGRGYSIAPGTLKISKLHLKNLLNQYWKTATSIILCFLFSAQVFAQTGKTWEEQYEQMSQLEDAESHSWEENYEELSELAANPLDINTCTREDLERLPFLSSQQVMDILEYRDRARRIQTTAELMLIPSIDWDVRQLLCHFITVRPERKDDRFPTLSSIGRYGKHEFVAMLNIPCYEREGDRDGYLGYQYKHWLRYTFTYGQRIKAGIVASQDAGEPFFAGKNRAGYDYYSAYLLIRDMGALKTLAVGRYRLRFGMGLILNNSFGLGKLNTLATLGRSTNHILAHSSRSEANYLQGAAATVTLTKGLDVTVFASWRKIDATLNKDASLNDDAIPSKDTASIATILTSGYHRTQSEMDRRRNAEATLVGGNINYFRNGFHVGVTGFHASYNRKLEPKEALFRYWYPRGKSFWNASVDYGYVSNRLNIAGETATGDCNHVATINSISYQLLSNLSLMALQRYYPYQYYSLYSESFADGGSVSNESGIYVGGNWQPRRGINVMFYTDYAYFPWAKYMVSESSHAWDNFVQLSVQQKAWTFLARYRWRQRERDNADKSALITRNEHRARLSLGYTATSWTSTLQVDGVLCHQPSGKQSSDSSSSDDSKGFMVSENISWHHRWLRVNGTVGYFHTDDYDSRVYTYERGVLYTFSFPSFYGEGIRYALSARADIGKKLMLIAKVGTTDYFDRAVISSGLQQINRSSKTDVELQLRWKF